MKHKTKEKMNKKGILGMETAKAVIMFLLLLTVGTIALFLAVTSLQDVDTLREGGQIDRSDSILSANGTTTTLTDVPTTFESATEKNRTYLTFDADGDLVTIPNRLSWSSNLSISLWTLIGRSDAGNNTIFNLTGNNLYYQTNSTNDVAVYFSAFNSTNSETNVSASVINVSNWHHIVITTHNNGTDTNMTIYTDNLARNSALMRGSNATFLSPTISVGGALSYNGSIDEVRLYNATILTGANVNSIFTEGRVAQDSLTSTGLFSWLPLNENSGTTAYDLSTSARNGTIIGAVYRNDGIDNVLTRGTDYTQSGASFIVINFDKSWSEMLATYTVAQTGEDVDAIANNITGGATQFFEQIPTVFSILGAVVIILSIILILVAVGRLTDSTNIDGGSSPSANRL